MLAACQMADSHFKGSGKTLHQIGESYPCDYEPFKIGGQKFVQDGHISSIHDLVVETTNESLVCFG
jgi:hypothetical protein